MKTFAEKVRDARAEKGMSQRALGDAVGVSLRSILAYEKGEKFPRQATLLRLAAVLEVSSYFLITEGCEDPMEQVEKDRYIEAARTAYGSSGAKAVQDLLNENRALFAGGQLSQDEKEAFFEAVLEAYLACKKEAREKFGKTRE